MQVKTRPGGGDLPIVLAAAAAIIDADGRALLAQRPEGPGGKDMAGLWEFPGGKVLDGETPEAALVRELKEELDMDITESCLAPFTFASHVGEKFHLLMPLYVCRVWKGVITPLEGQRIKWIKPVRMGDLEMLPADKPLAAMLRDFL
ncbi:MAG TPA: (deoxy)nucleoside triphosphate pyrophosphohydrolase [Rhodospirillales bacterium]|nr:(deoxy)nucleoside triphosphate pyrophosphohydrolase [Rhodospirillales bacterium]